MKKLIILLAIVIPFFFSCTKRIVNAEAVEIQVEVGGFFKQPMHEEVWWGISGGLPYIEWGYHVLDSTTGGWRFIGNKDSNQVKTRREIEGEDLIDTMPYYAIWHFGCDHLLDSIKK